ncbi:sigma-70 family RNA polymerase sigma factor [Vitiosangium sp. GDMCC 1.1324]|uniref:sigma-70 family RNA polymerase sigma factor n=1 Tax=Vitiosangium sp. (strain GDMCC 1.1324) TaxID=2138576 RepID=UPI0011B58AC8|nr:sigma-70 family RNA polymerase sigma factor [Vitiosangium sp. GDMCC 1.1324]
MDTLESLVLSFVARLPPTLREGLPAAVELERCVGDWLRSAQATWPTLSLDPGSFLAHVARCLSKETDARALDSLRAADLYLASGCAMGNAQAVALLEQNHGREVDAAWAKTGEGKLSREDLRQRVWQKLLVARPEQGPGICEYAGRGELRNWIRMVALREMLDAVRVRRAAGDPERLEELGEAWEAASPEEDPELAHIKSLYRSHFNDAFREALKALGPRERNLLRQTYVHGLSAAELAQLYRVHRVSVARWLADARRQVLEGTRSVLSQRLKLEGSQLDSILRMAQSGVDLSLERVLRTQGD